VGPMNDTPPATGPRSPDPVPGLRVAALIAAVLGVLVLTAAAFVLSYPGIHQLARTAGMPAGLARIFPVIFDALLVVAIAAVLSLHGASWWQRGYAWLITLLLLAAMAAGGVLHTLHTHIPHRPAAVVAAVLPWALLLIAFTLLLAMLHQFRQARLAATGQAAGQPTPAARTFEPRVGLDGLFPPAPAPVPPTPVPPAPGPAQPSLAEPDPATVRASTVPITRPVPARPGPAVEPAPAAEPGTAASTPANGKPASTAPANGKPTSTTQDGTKPTSSAPADTKPASTAQDGTKSASSAPVDTKPASAAADIKPAGTGPTDAAPIDISPASAEPASPVPADTSSADTSSAGASPAGTEPRPAGPDGGVQVGTGPDEPGPGAGEPAAGPGGGIILVPQQPMRAPVPAPAPHFDRLHSTPTPPEDDTGSGA